MRNLLALACAALLSSSALAAVYVPNGSDGHFFYKSSTKLQVKGGGLYGLAYTMKSDEDNTTMDEYQIFGEEVLKTWSRPLGAGQYDQHVALLADGEWRTGPWQQPHFTVTQSDDGKRVVTVIVTILDDQGHEVMRRFDRRAASCDEDGATTRDQRTCCGQAGPSQGDSWICGE